MSEPFLLAGALAAIVVLAIVAKRFELPYPVVFVIGGSAIAFMPGLPRVDVEPDWIFFTVLPPLLFAGGWTTDWNMFRKNLRPIMLLAIGLVIATTVVVAVVVEHIVPGFGWASAFVLGAIISPPDAVAASAVFERFSVPQRVATILEGEGLVNDGSALVIYRFAVAAAATGTFSLVHASAAFVGVAVGGVLAGLAIAFVIDLLARSLGKIDLDDSLIDNLILLCAPYIAYFSAEALHVSGVLATVAAGIVAGRRSSVIFEPETRLIGTNVWNLMTYLLNGFVFLLIGLQLRRFVEQPHFTAQWLPLGLGVSLLVIAVRLVWVFPATYLPRLLIPAIRRSEEAPPPKWIGVIGWTGFRGIVSLAAALALPITDAAGHPFPMRDPIIFITFCVIVVTLVGQGLSLIPVMAFIGIGDPVTVEQRELEVRIRALEAGLGRLKALEGEMRTTDEWEILGRSQAEYENRIAHLRGHDRDGVSTAEGTASRFDHHVQDESIKAERAEIMRLRDVGEIPDEVFRRVQYDLDLAESRLS